MATVEVETKVIPKFPLPGMEGGILQNKLVSVRGDELVWFHAKGGIGNVAFKIENGDIKMILLPGNGLIAYDIDDREIDFRTKPILITPKNPSIKIEKIVPGRTHTRFNVRLIPSEPFDAAGVPAIPKSPFPPSLKAGAAVEIPKK